MGTTSIPKHSSDILEEALGTVDKNFKKRIINTFLELKTRSLKAAYSGEFDSPGISAGKFCETVFRFVQHELQSGVYTPFSERIGNFSKELIEFEKKPKTAGHESIRLTIPRAIILIYTLRNKRGIGHVGGDVDANAIDAATIMKIADWVVAELIRIYYTLSLEEAQAVVDSLNTKSIPAVWEINGKKRILRNGMKYSDQVLILVYSDTENAVAVEDLFQWTEYSVLSMFKTSVLQPLHKSKLIEYDKETDFIHLSPLGIARVENELLEENGMQALAEKADQRKRKPK